MLRFQAMPPRTTAAAKDAAVLQLAAVRAPGAGLNEGAM